MKRKNKRHDSKGSPEKSPEKPSRRSNRHSKRRRKSSSSSSSPEREKKVHAKSAKDTAAVKDSSAAKLNEKVRSYTPELVTEKINKEVVDEEAGSSRRSSKRHSGNEQADTGGDKVALALALNKKDEGGGDSEWKEDKSFWEGDTKIEESADNKSKEKDTGSVWKVQSANGAGGEIQKLKICRQRMADSQSQDDSPSSPKRRSSRIKDAGQKNADEVSSDNEDQSNVDTVSADKGSKLKIRTRTSSRNSPALIDSPKVVCDVSEDNPTKIKFHIENKSPEKVPLANPISSNKDKTEESGSTEETSKDVVKEKDCDDNDEKVESVSEKKEDTEKDDKVESEEVVENNDGEAEKSLGEDNNQMEQLPLVVEGEEVVVESDAVKDEQPESKVIAETSEIVAPKDTAIEVTEENDVSKSKSNDQSDGKEHQKESSSHSSSPRPEGNEDTSSTTSSSSDGSQSDSDGGKKVKRKKRRKDGMQSAVSRQPRATAEPDRSPPTEADSGHEEKNGKQEPEEEGELDEAAEEEGHAEAKMTPVISDKENSVALESQTSTVSGTTEPVQRKRRWGASKTIRPPKKPVLCISTDSLKNLIPEAKPVPIEEVRLSVDEDGDRESDGEEREKSTDVKEIVLDDSKVKREKREGKRERDKDKDKEKDKERERERQRGEKDAKDLKVEKKVKDKKDIINKTISIDKPAAIDKVSRRICVLSEDARKLVRSPSPARHRPSSVLFITNLVRPFTVPQLRNLLARTGKIAENGFWIDKIKSKCYVQYTDEEAAIETRHALHGVRWPVSNPRTLCVEFASYDDMAVAQALSEETEPIPRKAEPLQVDHSVEGWLAEQARINIDRSQRRVVREWDVGKPAHPDEELDMRPSRPDYDDIRDRDRERERERERDRDRRIKKDRHRSRTPDIHEPPARKNRRKDEDAPAKLLDDLFRKTKTSPCIYWLPLTAEQIVVKEEMRRQHMAEHERRVAEMKKAELARRDRERRRK